MKYWVYMNGEVPGCYEAGQLAALPGFSQTTLVCPAEGEILEKNWRRGGEFPEIIRAVQERQSQRSPSAPVPAETPSSADVNALIDTASARLFSHVADLMKELENRREERALTQSLQRQLVDLKEQLQQEREKSAILETRIPRIAELEESVRKQQGQVAALESSLKAREDGLAELRIQLEKTRGEFENSKRRLGEALNDLAIRNRLVDKISRDLTEKELSLAKALGVIRRLEEDLHRLFPGAALPSEPADASAEDEVATPGYVPLPAPAQPPAPAASAGIEIPMLKPGSLLEKEPAPVEISQPLALLSAAEATPSAELAPPIAVPPPAYTTDEPPVQSPFIEPSAPGQPAAQNAIVDFFRKFKNKVDH